jgi:hypothetical protein
MGKQNKSPGDLDLYNYCCLDWSDMAGLL